MHNPLVMKVNENILWLSIILLTYLGLAIDQHYLIILIFWVVIILSVGNAKRFYSEVYYILFTIIRRSMYVLPFLLPVFFEYKYDFKSQNLLYFSLLGIILGLLFILPKWNEWRIVLSKDMIEFSEKKRKVEYYTEVYMLVGAAIGEELFFRNFIIGNIENSFYLIAILISSFLFFLNHYGVKWNASFQLYDYVVQIVFSVISAFLFIFSKSILPCILLHLIYNSPLIILSVKSYQFHYLSKKSDILNTLEKEI